MTKAGSRAVAARVLVATVITLGALAAFHGLWPWECRNPALFVGYFVVALLGSGMKVPVPGSQATLSGNFLFVMAGIVHLSLPETLVVALALVLVQCCWRSQKRPQLVQVLFNLAGISITVCASYRVFHSAWLQSHHVEYAGLLALLATVYFALNSLPVAAVVALTEAKSLKKVWSEGYRWYFPYYFLGAVAVGSFTFIARFVGLQAMLLALPVVYVIFRTYRLYLDRLESEQRRAHEEREHAEQMAALHLRTVEALALAIEAKDHTTHDHLQRVQIYAVEIGKELALSPPELEALRAAALLHDIGKLAVPEHIISKPGRLSPEEFEKMKIHPVVGAEILQHAQFPYPVAPIVAAHHESWDGTGYPNGLKGEEIPIGARILAAVDCLDALTSDRQYRRALPIDEAMKVVVSRSGSSYDPRIVAVLERRYLELEEMVRSSRTQRAKLSLDVKIERGSAPAAGFERPTASSHETPPEGSEELVDSIAAARREVQTFFELAQDLGGYASLEDTLSVLAMRLKKRVAFDGLAIYIREGDSLKPVCMAGEDPFLSSCGEISLGEGISGWVAQNRKPMVNANAYVEPGYGQGSAASASPRSALSIPLEALGRVVGVFTLYRAGADAFHANHLRILLAVGPKLAACIETGFRPSPPEDAATTDPLTRLPNARSLFLYLEREVARSLRAGVPLTVLVCDVNGFQQVNDRLGRAEGDRLLQAAAAGLKKICRKSDYVARLGGDEFVVVLPGIARTAALTMAGRLCETVAQAGVALCGHDVLSVSVGCATLRDDGQKAEELLAAADQRVYQAKRERQRQGNRYRAPMDLEPILERDQQLLRA